MSQLDIFSLESGPKSEEIVEQDIVEQPELITGDLVKVRSICDDLDMDLEPEDYYYLKSFQNKKGKVTQRLKNSNGKCSYRIEFDRDLYGYFYEEDLILLG